MSDFTDWLFDHFWIVYVLAAAGMVWLVFAAQKDLDRRCEGIMVLARTSRDSLDAKIACEKMNSDFTTAMAISSAASSAAAASYRGR